MPNGIAKATIEGLLWKKQVLELGCKNDVHEDE